jgi:hypothetical protein
MMRTTDPEGPASVNERSAGRRTSLGSFPTYGEARQVVDTLAERDFDIGRTQIVGSDLHMVEQGDGRGRSTWPRVLLSGIAGGAWFGALVALLLSILGPVAIARAMTVGVPWGVAFGCVFAVVGFRLTGPRRDLAARSAIVPGRFEVLVATTYSGRARAALTDAAWLRP